MLSSPIAPAFAGATEARLALADAAVSVELCNIRTDPSNKEQRRPRLIPRKSPAAGETANELAATAAKPLFLTTEFDAMRKRLRRFFPSLPGEELQFITEN